MTLMILAVWKRYAWRDSRDMIPARFVGIGWSIEGADRGQKALFPECVEDWIGEDNPVRVIDVFVDELDLTVCPWRSVQDRRYKTAALRHVAKLAMGLCFR
jgi:hypothetical protein